MTTDDVIFLLLGPLAVRRGGRLLPIGSSRQRAVLAALLLNAGKVVPVDELIEIVWGQRPPRTARNALGVHIAQLRRMLGPRGGGGHGATILWRSPGYLLQVRPEQVDLLRFERLLVRAREARAAGASERAARDLRDALGLWRGRALAGVPSEVLEAVEVARLEGKRADALEECIEIEIELGRHLQVLAELEGLVAAWPLRERLWGLLMVARYRSGRQAEALAAYREARQLLVEELGVEPGPELQRIERQILSADPTLEGPAGRASVSAERQRSAAGREIVPAQLPADVADFTGRGQHLEQLDRLLTGDGRATAVVLSAIAGTAGVGKTALAVHWAHRVRNRFPDGQLYVNLRGYAPAPPMRPIDALAGFLHALGVPAEQVPVELDEAAGLFRTLLADKRMLVLLDNARNAAQVRPLLPGSPGCLVLVTSRDRLGGLVARDGASRLTLDVLAPEEADALLARLLGEMRVRAEPEATAELARACGFLPLALRIAAANLADQPQQPIGGYLAGLVAGNRLAALEVDGDEQTAVRAAFDLSYAALVPDAQRLFRLLGLIPGPDVSSETAAALADTTPGQAARLLERLAAAHLLDQHAPGRFALHDLLRLYAAERAHDDDTADERQAATWRLYDWYLENVDAAARLLYPEKLRLPPPPGRTRAPAVLRLDDPALALAWLDAERANLVAAVTHTAEQGLRPAVWLLADALRGYFSLRMHTIDWLAVAHAGLAAAEADGDLRAQAAAQLSLADAHARQSRARLAIEHYGRALALSRQTGWLDGQASALGNVGNVYQDLGPLHEAADHYTQALAIHRQTGRLPGQAAMLGNLGLVDKELGRLEQAANHHNRALALDHQLGFHSSEANDLTNLAEIAHALGRLDHALDHVTRALSLHREVGDRSHEADALRVLAAIHRDAGRHTQALDLARSAVAQAHDTGERRYQADTLNTLATTYQCLGQHAQAIDHHQQALRLARQTEMRFPEVEALVGLADAHRCLAQPDQALACARQALTGARAHGFGVVEGRALTSLASIYLDQDEPDHAIKLVRQALDSHRETGHRLGEARTLVVLGLALERIGHREAALLHWQKALALLDDLGSPDANQVRSLLDSPA